MALLSSLNLEGVLFFAWLWISETTKKAHLLHIQDSDSEISDNGYKKGFKNFKHNVVRDEVFCKRSLIL